MCVYVCMYACVCECGVLVSHTCQHFPASRSLSLSAVCPRSVCGLSNGFFLVAPYIVHEQFGAECRNNS